MTIVTITSDLHGSFPKLPGGDLLIISGDFTAKDTYNELLTFSFWLNSLDYEKIVLVPGNHDNRFLEKIGYNFGDNVEILIDRGIEFQGHKIWGTPWTCKFKSINPACCAFTEKNNEDLKEHFDKIPEDTDILVSHCPPYWTLDRVAGWSQGSRYLKDKIDELSISYHFFGHIHEGYGIKSTPRVLYVNGSHVDKDYMPCNPAITIVI